MGLQRVAESILGIVGITGLGAHTFVENFLWLYFGGGDFNFVKNRRLAPGAPGAPEPPPTSRGLVPPPCGGVSGLTGAARALQNDRVPIIKQI